MEFSLDMQNKVKIKTPNIFTQTKLSIEVSRMNPKRGKKLHAWFAAIKIRSHYVEIDLGNEKKRKKNRKMRH